MTEHIANRGKNMWLVRNYLGKDAEGKRLYHNKKVEGNKRDAQAYTSKVLHEKEVSGTFIEPCKDVLGGKQ